VEVEQEAQEGESACAKVESSLEALWLYLLEPTWLLEAPSKPALYSYFFVGQ